MTLSNLTDSHYSNWKSSSKIVIKSRFRGNCVVEQEHPGAEQWSGIHCRLKACLLLTNIWVHWNILCSTHCRAKISQNERASHTRIQFGLDNIINFVNIIIVVSNIRCSKLDINLQLPLLENVWIHRDLAASTRSFVYLLGRHPPLRLPIRKVNET